MMPQEGSAHHLLLDHRQVLLDVCATDPLDVVIRNLLILNQNQGAER